MIELINILNAMQGKNEQNESKSGIVMSEYLMDATGKTHERQERSFSTPFTNIVVMDNFILVDLVFPKSDSAELRSAWYFLKNYGDKRNEHLDGAEANILELLIIPLEYNGQYFCSLINPVFWSLQPSAPGVQVDSIRMLFEKEAVNFLEGKMIDEKELEKEIENEIKEEQRLEKIETAKRIEREEYLDKMDKKFNRFDN